VQGLVQLPQPHPLVASPICIAPQMPWLLKIWRGWQGAGLNAVSASSVDVQQARAPGGVAVRRSTLPQRRTFGSHDMLKTSVFLWVECTWRGGDAQVSAAAAQAANGPMWQ